MDYDRMKTILKVRKIRKTVFMGKFCDVFFFQERLMASGLPAVPVVMDLHYRDTLGDAYTQVTGDDARATRGDVPRGGRGGGSARGAGGRGTGGRGAGGRGGGAARGSRGSAGDQVGRYPLKYTDAVTAGGEKICLKWNRGACPK